MKYFSVKLAALSAIVLGASALAASAVPAVSLIDSSTQGVGNDADVYGAGFDGSTPLGAAWFNGTPPGVLVPTTAPVVTPPPGNVPNSFQSPFANTPIVDSQTYFSVGGQANGDGGPSPMTLVFATPQAQLDILWGSIDSYNTLEFFDAVGTSLGAFTGTDINNDFSLGGSPQNFENVALLNFLFSDNELFTSASFTSTTQAFEFALPVQAIPLPAAVWMLLTAVAGLGFVSRRRKA